MERLRCLFMPINPINSLRLRQSVPPFSIRFIKNEKFSHLPEEMVRKFLFVVNRIEKGAKICVTFSEIISLNVRHLRLIGKRC